MDREGSDEGAKGSYEAGKRGRRQCQETEGALRWRKLNCGGGPEGVCVSGGKGGKELGPKWGVEGIAAGRNRADRKDRGRETKMEGWDGRDRELGGAETKRQGR